MRGGRVEEGVELTWANAACLQCSLGPLGGTLLVHLGARLRVALPQAPNVNALWAGLIVEELCRLGCNTFCVAPGRRAGQA